MAKKTARERRAEKRAKLQEFYEEIEKNEAAKTAGESLSASEQPAKKEENESGALPREKSKAEKLFCPKCGAELETRKSRCPRCGYEGYVPLSDAQSKKIRWILFAVLGVIAVALLIWRGMKAS